MNTLVTTALKDYVVDLACRIQQVPAPTFRESQRAEFVQGEMQRLGLHDVQCDATGNVWSCWPGGGGRPLVVSAHLDTVHTILADLPLAKLEGRIHGPGIADNSLGLAALLGAGSWLVQTGIDPGGPVWLVANVGEEGLGNLAGMKTVVNRFGEEALAYLVLEGLGLGQICHRGLGVIRYRISAETCGGHAWVNYGTPSAIHELSRLVAALADIPIPPKPRTSLNVGRIGGGVSINTIASDAWCEIDLRSEDQVYLSRLASRVRKIAQSSQRQQVTFRTETIGNRPAGQLSSGHPLIRLAAGCLEELNLPVTLEIGSTDANIPLSQGLPAICLGITYGGAPHTQHEFIETGPVSQGMEQLLQIIQRAWMMDGLGR